MFKAIIIDDEPMAREIIREYLEGTNIEIAGEYGDGFSGLKGINEHNPALIFLDIQMPKLTGFEMLELIDDPPEIIFATAYDDYAIRAFEENAVDYLLKPFSEDRFAQAIQKALSRLKAGRKSKNVEKLRSAPLARGEFLRRIVIRDRGEIHIIPVDDVIFFEAQDDYVMIHTSDRKFIKQTTMTFFEENLDASQFLRVHRSPIFYLRY
jgi:two-component system LytT family response regulator